MKVEKENNKFIIHCDDENEHALLNVLLTSLDSSSEKDFNDALVKYKKILQCPNEKLFGNKMISQCALPMNHKGNRHMTFFIWKD